MDVKPNRALCINPKSFIEFLLILSLFLKGSAALAASVNLTDGRSSVSVEELQTELLAIPPDIRGRIVSDKAALSRFVTTLLLDRRVAAAALEAGLAKLPEIKAPAERTLRDQLINRYLSDEAAHLSQKAPEFRALAKEKFEAHRSDYMRVEAVRVAHILIPVDVEDERVSETEQRANAEAVLARLKDGADFAQVAKEVSGDKGSANRGGEIPGWVERGKTVPPFEKAAFALKPGQLSPVVRTRYGFHVIKQLEYRKPSPKEFSEVEDQLVAKAKADYQAERRSEIVKRFAGTEPVEIDDTTFEAIKAK